MNADQRKLRLWDILQTCLEEPLSAKGNKIYGVCKAVVVTILLHDSECWLLYRYHQRILERFYHSVALDPF